MIRRAPNRGATIMWWCKCSCGTEKAVSRLTLCNGQSRSCGCKHSVRIGTIREELGIIDPMRHPLYNVWNGIISRCYDPKNASYLNYGGRGIGVCDEWRYDLVAFFKWALNNGWALGLSIDRIDNDGPYAPWNCRWVNIAIQNRNRRNSLYYEMNGKVMCLADWTD